MAGGRIRPDYLKLLKLSKKGKKQFLEEYKKWKDETDLKFSTEEFALDDLRALTDQEVLALVAWLETITFNTTAGHKVYVNVTQMAEGRAEFPVIGDLATDLDVIGDRLCAILREKTGLPYKRLKAQDLLLMTFGAHMTCKTKWKFPRPKYIGQLAHLDAPALVEGIDDGAPIVSAFVSLTDRAATQHCFDLGLDELLQGKTWSEDEEDNKWILWRLCFAHMAAFEAKMSESAVCQAGSVTFFDPYTRWHAGQEALLTSKVPEVLVLFQFALEPIAAFYDQNFQANVGFGQHAWTPEQAEQQLREIQENTFNLAQIQWIIAERERVSERGGDEGGDGGGGTTGLPPPPRSNSPTF